MRKIARTTLLLIAVAILAPKVTIALAEGDEFKACARCHGEDGNSQKSSSPSIAGMSTAYSEQTLRDYRDGKRACGTSKLKCRMAAKWTDEEIVAASAYFAQFDRVAPEQSFDAGLAEQGKAIHEDKCASCHSAGSSAGAGDQPADSLNGQWREYLEYTLQQYAEGGRQQPDEMRAALESLDDSQKDALLNYYASGL